MGAKTGISWTNSTWNPLRGCSRVSEGCRNCYAEKVASRFSGSGLPYEGLTRNGKWNGKISFIEEHLLDPLHWKKPSMIFVNSMSDLFHENVRNEWIDQIFAVMALASQHTFQILTKRPERMLDYMRAGRTEICIDTALHGLDNKAWQTREHIWPLSNVWLGVSVEDQKTADERIPLLLAAPAAKRFVSYEPALGPVDFTMIRLPLEGESWMTFSALHETDGLNKGVERAKLDWVIVGGESGPGARPFDIQWARSTVEQCKKAGVACFVKQLGSYPIEEATLENRRDSKNYAGHLPAKLKDRKGGDWNEWSHDLRVREFPL